MAGKIVWQTNEQRMNDICRMMICVLCVCIVHAMQPVKLAVSFMIHIYYHEIVRLLVCGWFYYWVCACACACAFVCSHLKMRRWPMTKWVQSTQPLLHSPIHIAFSLSPSLSLHAQHVAIHSVLVFSSFFLLSFHISCAYICVCSFWIFLVAHRPRPNSRCLF